MKRVFQISAVIILVIGIVAVARTSDAWAGAFPQAPESQVESAPLLSIEGLGDPSQQFTSISISDSGVYYLGGICAFEVEFKADDVRNEVDIEVPVEESRLIPYFGEGDIYLPGCHIVHFKDDEEVTQANLEDGSWRVCFGERPDVNLVVYYYLDAADPKSWIALPTTHEDGLACAQALYTGEYAPVNEPEPPLPPDGTPTATPAPGETEPGSILPPPDSIIITGSGTYSVGGICTLEVIYKKENISDHVHVQDPIDEDPVDWDTNVPFPDEGALLYQPGCHVLHYDGDEIVRWEQGEPAGSWEICFAARPDKEMTIYYYLGDLEEFASPWIPLETTVENGMACAPAQFTGMYTPAGK